MASQNDNLARMLRRVDGARLIVYYQELLVARRQKAGQDATREEAILTIFRDNLTTYAQTLAFAKRRRDGSSTRNHNPESWRNPKVET